MRARPPCFAIWRQQDLGDIAGAPWNRADPTSSRKQHESVYAGGMADRELLGDCAAVGVPDDIRFSMPTASRTRAATSDNMGIEYGTTESRSPRPRERQTQ